ncbi:MAG TPA: hypothetical protein VGE02_02995 [Gemmatimonadales bacterium]
MTDHDSRHEPASSVAGDEPLEGWLAELAADHNRPPVTPREEIWARIQAARARGSAPPSTVPAPMVATQTRWLRPMLALAATLLLGVAIGRWWSLRPGGDRPEIAAATSQPALPELAPGSAMGPSVAAPGPAGPAMPDAPPAAGPAVRDESPATRRDAPGPEPVYASTNVPGDGAPEPTGAARASDASALLPYRVATVQHLGQVEALLTAFRAEPPREGGAPSLEPWARDLLTTTRLLLDSPAAADPRLGPLLGDLEAVLVQIVQLPAARAAEERQIIAQSLDEGDLLIQLRSAVPAGPAVPQRSGE